VILAVAEIESLTHRLQQLSDHGLSSELDYTVMGAWLTVQTVEKYTSNALAIQDAPRMRE